MLSIDWILMPTQFIPMKLIKFDKQYIMIVFIMIWTLTVITPIYSHYIHNHIPISIIIVIYNSMHVARTRSWLNHHFYHDLVRNIWFFVCKLTYVSFHELFL